MASKRLVKKAPITNLAPCAPSPLEPIIYTRLYQTFTKSKELACNANQAKSFKIELKFAKNSTFCICFVWSDVCVLKTVCVWVALFNVTALQYLVLCNDLHLSWQVFFPERIHYHLALPYEFGVVVIDLLATTSQWCIVIRCHLMISFLFIAFWLFETNFFSKWSTQCTANSWHYQIEKF